jgi:hypothetical protein
MTLQNLLGISLDAVTPHRETVARLLAAAERNLADYDGDPVPDSAVRDCIAGARALFVHVKQWLTANRPDLL